ncbi:VIR protein [Plasmodium vivax]|uniref:VIR protein n=1 Tax=Plasmodium vivax TaxID=5855 RepID=A0A1G4E3D7_PLAVI|nr:VIR protein [Plasmodium vivax]
MEDTETEKTYYSYDEYHKLKTDFTPYYEIQYSTTLLNEIINSMSAHPNLKNGYNKVFTQLKKYLNRGFAFYKYPENYCCKFINVWLNKEIRNPNYGVNNEDQFKIFKEFMDKYVQHKSDAKCKQGIHFINNDINLKMINLYNLYDKYEELKKINTSNIQPLCSKYNELVQYYNNFIYQYNGKSSDYLKKKVDNFKSLIENFETSNNRCQKNVQPLSLEIEKIPLPEQKHIMDSQTIQHKDEPERLGEDGLKLHNAIGLTDQNELQEQTPVPESLELTSDLQEAQSEPDEIARRLENVENQVNQGVLHFSGGFGLLKEVLDEPQKKKDPREGEENIPRYNEGVIGTMKNAISGFINDVEPAPILGVSGGMGALFLLFKYTPVGTFFRGGRRINNQIPRTFYGQFPGGFPGYEEFYDGSFGPGPINISYRAERE